MNELESKYCIDTDRIFTASKSNGGGFCGTLACSEVGGRFAAFAPVAGAFYTDATPNAQCDPAKVPVPILEFHGLADKTIDYEGGTSHDAPLPKILDWLERWAVRDGCDSKTKPTIETTHGGNVFHYSWPCHVHHYAINGLGHVWPSKSPNFENAQGTYIEATELIMKFFNTVAGPKTQ